MSQIRYRAFLSYSHRDRAWAKWIHAAIENYQIEKDLVGRPTHAGPVPKTLRPIFRDREDFSAGHSLTQQTMSALESAEFMIVLCSPHAAKSRYVNEEVRFFKELGRSARIIPLIVSGEPGHPTEECFPTALRFKLDPNGHLSTEAEEPIAADVRSEGDGKELAKQKVVAGLLGLGLDEVIKRAARARRRRTRRVASLVGVLLLLTATATGSAVYAYQQLKTNDAFLDATLATATDIVNTAVAQAEKYNVPRAAALDLLGRAEALFDAMARFGRPTPELLSRKAAMLLEFSRNYAVLGNTQAQLTRAEAAHEIFREPARKAPNDPLAQKMLHVSHTQLGDTLRSQGLLEDALAHQRAAHDIAQRFISAGMDAWESLLISKERIGDILKMQGQFAEAEGYYKEMLRIQEQRYYQRPPNSEVLNGLAIAHERIGNVLAALGRHAEALVEYRAMHRIDESLSENEPTNVDWQRNLTVSYGKVGSALLALGKPTEALVEFRQELAVAERLGARDPTHAGWQRDISVAQGYVGDALLALGDREGAIKSFNSQLAIRTRLARLDPNNADWQADLAYTLASLGDSYVASGDLDNALASYRGSHPVWERALAIDPSRVEWQMELLWSHSRLALFLDRQSERINFILSTLQTLKAGGKLNAQQELWLPYAEQARAALTEGDGKFQWAMLQIYWQSASMTSNPVRQAALVVAMLRKLKRERGLTQEQARWLPVAEAQMGKLQHEAPIKR